MFAFVVYAVVVWLAAAKWRRRWPSLVAVAAGLAGLLLVALFHYQLNEWTHGRIYLPVLQVLLYPYAGLVGLVGLYIAALPRNPIPWAHCPACQYDLRGLDHPVEACPECGMTEELARHVLGRGYKGFPAPGVNPEVPARARPAQEPRRAIPQWPASAAARASPDPANE